MSPQSAWGAGNNVEDQAEDIGPTITGRLADAWKVDAEWSAPIDGGFRWWAHRLEQRITVIGDEDDRIVLRAETTVLTNVPDQAAAVALLAGVNQRSGTFALCYAADRRAVVATSTVTMNGWYEPTYHWFSHASLLQIGQAEAWADALAAELGADVAVSAHPGSGPRPEPDEMLEWNDYQRSRPEWVIGSYELVPLVEQLAAEVEEGLELSRGEGPSELRAWPSGYSFPLSNPWRERNPFRATVANAIWHPDLGPGARLQVTAPFTLGKSAAALANLLNSGSASVPTALLGAWWGKDGQVGFTAFLPQALLSAVLGKPGGDVGDQIGIADAFTRLAVLGQKIHFCEALDESGLTFGDAEPPAAVSGYSDFLDRLLLAERRRIVTDAAVGIPAWSSEEYRADPAPVTDLGRVDPDYQLAIYGTFNPVGPTLNVLGALGLGDGRYLLANWMRHPFSPSYTALLVLPDLEPATVWDAMAEVLPFFGVPAGTEFASVYEAPETLQVAAGEAFKRAAEDRGEPERLWAVAHALEEHGGNPWSRLSGSRRAPGRLPSDPAEVAAGWWTAVAGDADYTGHLTSFTQAWDGAIRFLESHK